jgi:hypothetical protein
MPAMARKSREKMKIKGCRNPGFDGQSAFGRNLREQMGDADMRKKLEKIPGVRFEVRNGIEIVVGLDTLTSESIPASVHPAVKLFLFRRIAKGSDGGTL